MVNARMLAYQILLHLEQKPSQPERLIRAMLDRHRGLEERDRALLTELVYGVLRWRGRLDWHIDALSKISPKKIDPAVRILLRLALYQILLLDRIPPHAAVNETVKIARATQAPHVAGFINAVLREAIRREDRWQWPSRESAPDRFLAVTTSHPLWFVQRCLRDFGFEETLGICEANNAVAPLVLRVNTLKTGRSLVLEWLASQGLEAEGSSLLPCAVKAVGIRQDVTKWPIFSEGLVQVQDEASQLVAHLVSPEPGERVLDLCAGFGGKSTHLGILMGNAGEITAVDQSAWKLEQLKENARRQGICIVSPLAADVLELPPETLGSFDRVLLDAPCSGFGTLRRKPDIKWRRSPKDPYRFGMTQRSLLAHAAKFVKKGGVLVYATCTVFSEEDEQVARHFTEDFSEWALERADGFLPESSRGLTDGPFLRSLPHRHGTDGFFGARWRRTG
ncbi:MAG: 16S rRNA (cytosine(967)-C(5))-methyltransferase RsmB [Syntrophobacteraceae bacterium]|nr:16S rRNA (cytosine(967)-C(5))-methyltransferase RsmB [Desulfobacteraceae bacterium]